MKTFCQYVLSNTIKIFKLNMRSEIRYDYHALMLATWNLYFCSMRKFVNYSFKITSNFKKVYTKERRPLPVRQFILRIFNNTKNLYFLHFFFEFSKLFSFLDTCILIVIFIRYPLHSSLLLRAVKGPCLQILS